MIRGIRGATTVESNSQAGILEATQELLQVMIDSNGIVEDDVASVLFSATPELDDTFPAQAARMMGWTRTALMAAIAFRSSASVSVLADREHQVLARVSVRKSATGDIAKSHEAALAVSATGAPVLGPCLQCRNRVQSDDEIDEGDQHPDQRQGGQPKQWVRHEGSAANDCRDRLWTCELTAKL